MGYYLAARTPLSCTRGLRFQVTGDKTAKNYNYPHRKGEHGDMPSSGKLYGIPTSSAHLEDGKRRLVVWGVGQSQKPI